jgi:hypothetical protein
MLIRVAEEPATIPPPTPSATPHDGSNHSKESVIGTQRATAVLRARSVTDMRLQRTACGSAAQGRVSTFPANEITFRTDKNSNQRMAIRVVPAEATRRDKVQKKALIWTARA